MSEDFYRVFRLGDSDKHITPTDLSGVALAAIQGLLRQLESTGNENRQLKEESAEVQNRLARLESLLTFLVSAGSE